MRPPTIIGSLPVATMASADFSSHNPYGSRSPSVRWISLYLSLLHLLFRLLLEDIGTSAACDTSSSLIASYVVPVRQYRYRSLAYFSAWITPNHLATCLASGHDPSAYGTFTLWITQFHELNSPFKAHTSDMAHASKGAIWKCSVNPLDGRCK